MDVVYLDNNATTRPAPEVVEAMLPYLTEWYGNPSSVHRFGQRSRQAVEEARGQIATRQPRRKIVTTTVEHSATRELCSQLEREGFETVAVEVGQGGELEL